MRKREKSNLDRFNQKRANYHIMFGIAMATTHLNRPFVEAIVIYRERTGDKDTEDKRLYQVWAEMVELFKLPSDEVVNL